MRVTGRAKPVSVFKIDQLCGRETVAVTERGRGGESERLRGGSVWRERERERERETDRQTDRQTD